MSNMIAWIAAEAEPPKDPKGSIGSPWQGMRQRGDALPEQRAREARLSAQDLSAHQIPANQVPPNRFSVRPQEGTEQNADLSSEEAASPTAEERQWELAERREHERERRVYRGRTIAMLRRYLRFSIETGRLPSLLGSEFFRAKVTAYTVVTFEDRVIFVHDMETCLERLDEFSRQLIARHILQEHDQAATSRLLQCSERTVRSYVPIALDLLSEILLELGLMDRLVSNRKKSCQEGGNDQNSASDCEDGKYKF